MFLHHAFLMAFPCDLTPCLQNRLLSILLSLPCPLDVMQTGRLVPSAAHAAGQRTAVVCKGGLSAQRAAGGHLQDGSLISRRLNRAPGLRQYASLWRICAPCTEVRRSETSRGLVSLRASKPWAMTSGALSGSSIADEVCRRM